MPETNSFKQQAAVAAVDRVESGMVVGLGTGSTTRFAVIEIGERLADGRLHDVSGVPTSEATAALARERGIPLVDLSGLTVQVAIDGADEIGPGLALTKGGGGALLREKIVAAAAATFVVIADDSKLVPALGTAVAIPLEVARFGVRATLDHLRALGRPRLRLDGDAPAVTDNDNFLVDLEVGPIAHPGELDARLVAVPGVLGTGLFVGLADLAFVVGRNGLRRLGTG